VNTKIILSLADYINAYEYYLDKLGNKKIMTKLTRVYNKILENGEKYSDNFDKYNNACLKKNLYQKFQDCTNQLKNILLDK
jgi:hypothetical protein